MKPKQVSTNHYEESTGNSMSLAVFTWKQSKLSHTSKSSILGIYTKKQIDTPWTKARALFPYLEQLRGISQRETTTIYNFEIYCLRKPPDWSMKRAAKFQEAIETQDTLELISCAQVSSRSKSDRNIAKFPRHGSYLWRRRRRQEKTKRKKKRS